MLSACFLNIWGGRRYHDFAAFAQTQSVDIWSFTEMNSSKLLDYDALAVDPFTPYLFPNFWEWDGLLETDLWIRLAQDFSSSEEDQSFRGWFAPTTISDRYDIVAREKRTDVLYGSAMLYTPQIEVVARGSEFIFGEYNVRTANGVSPRLLQWIVVEYNGKRYLIAHFHGIWIKGATKADHPDRELQSKNVVHALSHIKINHAVDEVILGGDFNLDIKTDALRMLEAGNDVLSFRNLIREFNIRDTRTPLYRSYRDDDALLHADYVLVTEGVTVHSFEAPAVAVSDHRPLMIEFS